MWATSISRHHATCRCVDGPHGGGGCGARVHTCPRRAHKNIVDCHLLLWRLQCQTGCCTPSKYRSYLGTNLRPCQVLEIVSTCRQTLAVTLVAVLSEVFDNTLPSAIKTWLRMSTLCRAEDSPVFIPKPQRLASSMSCYRLFTMPAESLTGRTSLQTTLFARTKDGTYIRRWTRKAAVCRSGGMLPRRSGPPGTRTVQHRPAATMATLLHDLHELSSGPQSSADLVCGVEIGKLPESWPA